MASLVDVEWGIIFTSIVVFIICIGIYNSFGFSENCRKRRCCDKLDRKLYKSWEKNCSIPILGTDFNANAIIIKDMEDKEKAESEAAKKVKEIEDGKFWFHHTV